jgi:dihydrodipicolinate synthase/N-acetylneuraminate lyase
MDLQPITPARLASSVISVPPLARTANGEICTAQNRRLVEHLLAGGVTTLLYGGNAMLHHVGMSEYDGLLTLLCDCAAEDTLMIPSVGPFFGTMMDQAALLQTYDFPTAMVLPTRDMVTSSGVATGIRRFAEKLGKPAVLYIKHDGYIEPDDVAKLVDDGCLSWIKYAIVRDNPENDDYLDRLVERVDRRLIVSGIGEQPAISHVLDRGLQSFTSGCVCVAPALSMSMLAALRNGERDASEQIRRVFSPLEELRNQINPVRVLHAAIQLVELAETGPLIPLSSEITAEQAELVRAAAETLLKAERSAAPEFLHRQ